MARLIVENFLGLKRAELDFGDVTVVIGEQASGKSVIARLCFFFEEYFAGFDELSLSRNEHKSTYDKGKKQDFCTIFPSYAWESQSFTITYETDKHTVVVSSASGSAGVDIKTSASVATYFRELKKAYQKFAVAQTDEGPLARSRLLREFRRVQEELGLPRYHSALFVPAARSFYSTIRDEIFSILALDNKIDRIILQFGEFYESAKERTTFLRLRSPSEPKGVIGRTLNLERKYFESVVKGSLVRIDGRDWLEMKSGRIELAKASSGQQEAVPLIMALCHFPAPGRFLIIEEPEAHLFPSAQVEILKLIVSQAQLMRTKILFTTHSPYLLSSLNNIILGSRFGRPNLSGIERICAYSLLEGKSHDLVDPGDGMISAEYIDQASETIEAEMNAILEGGFSE